MKEGTPVIAPSNPDAPPDPNGRPSQASAVARFYVCPWPDFYSVTLKNGEWVIADSNSVNGLRVNGTYYHQATLSAGDVVELGEVKMRLLADGEIQ